MFVGNELFIKGSDISVYDEGSVNNHNPRRDKTSFT